MNIVTGDRKQLSPNPSATYQVEACGTRSYAGNNPLHCLKTDNITDQFIEDVYCGLFALNVKRCAKPDIAQCAIGKSSNGEDPVAGITWLVEAPNIRCFYDSKKLDTLNQLENYRLLFGENKEYAALAARFCSDVSSNGLEGTKHSRLKASDSEGDFCRTFYNTQSIQDQESIGQNICLANPDLPECACYSRAKDPTYKKLSATAPFKDSCWYVPCRDSLSNLIPGDLRDPECPSNVCQFILDAANNNNVSISEIKSSIDCKSGPTPSPPSDTSFPYLYKILLGLGLASTAVVVGLASARQPRRRKRTI